MKLSVNVPPIPVVAFAMTPGPQAEGVNHADSSIAGSLIFHIALTLHRDFLLLSSVWGGQ